MSDDHILYAYALDGKGGAEKITGQAISDLIKDDRLAWAHFYVDHPTTNSWLNTEVPYLDPMIVDALLAGETRPRATEIGDGILVILRGVNLNAGADTEDMVSIRMWIDQHRIISTRKRKLKSVVEIREKLEEGKGPKNSADFLALLCSKLVEKMDPVLVELDDRLDAIEEEILSDPSSECRKVLNEIRQDAIQLRRYIAPQKEAMAALRMTELQWITANHKRHLQESLDRLTRYVEDLDAIRERAQIMKDEIANALADRMNKNLYTLSLVAALFLPLGFLTGLLGINVGGMPGVDSDMAFWIVCGLCAIVFVIEYLLFRFLRWL